MIKAGLIDYEMGNLKSVAKALEKVGARVQIVRSPSELGAVDLAVLPGVGSFAAAVRNLRKRNLFRPLQGWIREGKPFLGICLGYQLLFETGEEAKKGEKGLGLFKGSVRRFPRTKNLKVPHMGWNEVRWNASKNKAVKKLSKELGAAPYFYFVHSYFPVPEDKNLEASKTAYGAPFASSIACGNLFACQFHPEKSGENGLKLLSTFLGSLKC